MAPPAKPRKPKPTRRRAKSAEPTLRTLRGLLERRERELRDSGRRLRRHPSRGAVHDHRRNARRVEAVAHLLEPYLTPPAYSDLRGLTAKLGRGLGRLRDADVLGQRVRALADAAPAELRRGLRAFARTVEHRGRKRRARARAAHRRARAKRLRKPLRGLLAGANAGAADPLRMPTAKVRLRARRPVAAGASPETLHALRLELRAFLYATQALADARVRGMRTLAREAQAACRLLGEFSDGLVLARAAQDAQAAVRDYLAAHAAAQQASARAAFARAWAGGRWPALAVRLGVPREAVQVAFGAPPSRVTGTRP